MPTIGSKAISSSRILASAAILFGAIFTVLLVPAYGQQEVDPTWYDPTPNTAIAQPVQAAAVVHAPQATVSNDGQQVKAKSASATPIAAKSHAKDKQLNQNRHDAARKSVGTPAARNQQPGTVGHATLEARNFDIYRSPDGPITR